MKLSVVPAYGERATKEETLNRVFVARPELDKEIIVVDDGSTDENRLVLESIIRKKSHRPRGLRKADGRWGQIGVSIRKVLSMYGGRVKLRCT